MAQQMRSVSITVWEIERDQLDALFNEMTVRFDRFSFTVSDPIGPPTEG